MFCYGCDLEQFFYLNMNILTKTTFDLMGGLDPLYKIT
jgi:hypothetical protein